MQAMLQQLQPPPRFYLKVDTDTLVLPRELMRFLAGLASSTNRHTPLYFGNAAGTCPAPRPPARAHLAPRSPSRHGLVAI